MSHNTLERKLLVDYIGAIKVSPQQIQESITANRGRLIVTGILQRSDSLNQNRRIYPKAILQKQASVYKDTFVAENRAMGELDHPESSTVNLKYVSHNLLDLWWEGDNLMGKLEIIDETPCGQIAKALLKAGIRLGISSRGLGSVKELGEGKVEVQDDLEFVAWDLVSNPSTQGGFVAPSLNEGKGSKHSVVTPYAKVNDLIAEIISMA